MLGSDSPYYGSTNAEDCHDVLHSKLLNGKLFLSKRHSSVTPFTRYDYSSSFRILHHLIPRTFRSSTLCPISRSISMKFSASNVPAF